MLFDVIRTGLGSRGLVNLTRETAVCSLAVQTHSIQYLQVLPSDEINACSGFENWSRNMIDGSCVIEHHLSFFTAFVRLPIRHVLTAFA